MRRVKAFGRWAVFLLGPLLGGGAAFFFSAKLTSSVAMLIVAGLFTNALLAVLCARLVARKYALVATAIAMTAFAAIGWALLFRRPPPITAQLPDRGVRFERLQLSTGSRLAVARFHPGASRAPVVFLHGGPGRPNSSSDVAFFRALSEHELDVVLFDQAGVGESDPLPRAELTVERAIADLEALRVDLGADKISLVGQSWGARLAYEYTAKHPSRVERLAVAGGAPLTTDPNDWRFDERRTALGSSGRAGIPTAFIGAMLLHKLNPTASEHFAGREELNALVASIVPVIMKRCLCAKDHAAAVPPSLAGLDGAQFLTVRQLVEDHAAPFIATPPPSLVLRAECDFAPWGVAREYRKRLGAQVVYIAGVGHAIWPLRADHAEKVLAAFLRSEPLPVATYEGETDPAGE